MRTLVVILCITAIFACPYACAIRQAAACSGEDVQVECSEGCCHHDAAPVSGDESPKTPSPQEDGVTCVCEGAVFCDSTDLSLDTDALVLFVPWTQVSDLIGLTALHVGCDQVVPALALLDGKSTRIVLRSLQV